MALVVQSIVPSMTSDSSHLKVMIYCDDDSYPGCQNALLKYNFLTGYDPNRISGTNDSCGFGTHITFNKTDVLVIANLDYLSYGLKSYDVVVAITKAEKLQVLSIVLDELQIPLAGYSTNKMHEVD
ncbi:hypothetical protein LOTGIDRAFT_165751 [Lottia gigantea]|uniref:Uncharacterized protein n=1 Tax=Lottia gigantea TaxID=225164 RepID=V3ZBA4_LOTGI|nr:hypothetical protein LOTGIDRAFT_165751 [Lottia gigantea]ESO88308.1 hypothetical protein LOTGIDRAFT_165751 [Lottia gigantea]